MCYRQPLPDWLRDAREEIAATPEWLQLSEELLRAVRSALAAQGIASFARLDPIEQRVLLRSAAGSLRDSSRFRLFSAAAWRLLDLHLDAESNLRSSSVSNVPGRARVGGPPPIDAGAARGGQPPPSKAASIEALSAEGCTALLTRFSLEEAGGSCLTQLVGTQLPPPLRRSVWRRLLQCPSVARDYAARCEKGRLAVLSPRDASVLHEARAVLGEALTPSEAAEAEGSATAAFDASLLRTPQGQQRGEAAKQHAAWLAEYHATAAVSSGDEAAPPSLLARVKCALSYHDMLKPISEKPPFFWIVPFAVVFRPQDGEAAAAERRGAAAVGGSAAGASGDDGSLRLFGGADDDLALLVELYASLLRMPRPSVPPEPEPSGARQPAERIFAAEFDGCLSGADPELWAHLLAVLNGRAPPPSVRSPAPAAGEGRADAPGPSLARSSGAAGALRPPHFDRDGSLLPETPVRALVREAVERLFVGAVPMRTVLYVWDTCLLAGWFQLAPISAAWLVSVRAPLLEARTPADVRASLARASRALSVESLQRAMELHFMARVREGLGVPLRADLDHLAFGEPHEGAQRTNRYLDAFHAAGSS